MTTELPRPTRRPAVPPPSAPMLDVAEVAERLRVGSRTVRRLIAAGALPAHRIGRLIRIGEEDLRHYLTGYQ